MDLFAYDRTPEEALEQLRRTKGLTRESAGGGGGDGKARDDGLSKSGTLEQVMARLQLQSHINQVRTGHEAIIVFEVYILRSAPRLRIHANEVRSSIRLYSCCVALM